MKEVLCFLCICIAIQFPMHAQSRQEAEQQFLKELNAVLKNSTKQYWPQEGRMTIDSFFFISKAGVLSVTVRYSTDTSFFRVRTEAPINKIVRAVQDNYLLLGYNENVVMLYNSVENKNDLQLRGRTDLFHIGIVDNEGVTTKKVQKLLGALLKYYPISP